MQNPINNTIFDSRELIEYRDYLANQLADFWNELECDGQTGEKDFPAEDVNEIFGTGGYEFAEDCKEFFEEFEGVYEDEIHEYKGICDFCDDLSYCDDFEYGSSIIHESYFTKYTEDLLVECGYIPRDLPSWIEIDYEATAENVKIDYTEVTYKGDSYYAR